MCHPNYNVYEKIERSSKQLKKKKIWPVDHSLP